MNYAERLEGLLLKDGWRVGGMIPRAPGATGGTFSRSYLVQKEEGHKAFLKAIDLSWAFAQPDFTRSVEAVLRAYNYERDLLLRCASTKMDRIVTVWDYGEAFVDPGMYFSRVPYLIFELADGDVHKHLRLAADLDVAWTLKTLHDVAVGLVQLHGQKIAHQDIKPSNVVFFEQFGAKLGDLGRASLSGAPIDHDELSAAGDKRYTPPELLYGIIADDWLTRRLGCVVYMFGALAVFLFSGLCVAAEVQLRLPMEYRVGVFGGSYADLLPFLRTATNALLMEIEGSLPSNVQSDLGRIIRQLCDPDPTQRGHPAQRAQKHGNPFDLRRFVTEIDVLRRRVEASIVRRAAVR